MTPEIASLMSDVSFWEFWGYAALAAVLIGVIGESIKEFTDWLERTGWEKKISRLSALILIAGLAGEGITQPKTNAVNATLIAFLNKQSGQLAIDLEKEKQITSARPWKKEQFDAIQEIKGVVTGVGILWPEHCIECQLLGRYIESALVSAGVQIYGARGGPDTGVGIFVHLPIGSDLNNHPLIIALGKAGLKPASAYHFPDSKIRTDIPVIFVGERSPALLAMPYQPPGQTSWTELRIERQ
jgi:hypothetical protein